MSYFAGVFVASAVYILAPLVAGQLKLNATEWAAWMQAFGAVAGIGVAVWLPYAQRAEARDDARVGQLETIAVDVTMAKKQAEVYLKSRYIAPAYRLELNGRGQVLTSLLASGALSSEEASHLVQFYVDATSFNFCLDRLQALIDEERLRKTRLVQPNADEDLHEAELRRTQTKARHLVSGTSLSRYDPAVQVLKRHLPKASLERLALLEPEPSEE